MAKVTRLFSDLGSQGRIEVTEADIVHDCPKHFVGLQLCTSSGGGGEILLFNCLHCQGIYLEMT